jgi:L-rhamnose isomerase
LASKVEQAKAYLDELRKKIADLNVEVTEWKVGGGGTDAGTTIELSIKLLVPKQKR